MHRMQAALFAKGFRPFFVLAALYAVLVLPAWILVHAGRIRVASHLLPAMWHAPEMVFGVTVAVIAGFLLPAASNWTQRPTATGGWLAALCVAWLAGRALPWLGDAVPHELAAAIQLSFLPLLTFAVGRVVLAARSRRNYGLVALLAALFAAQLAMHLGALGGSIRIQTAAPIVAVDLVVLVILVVGGRIIPLFTRNATKAGDIRNVPWLDHAAIAAALAVAAADAAGLFGWPLALITGAAALANGARMLRWGTRRALSEPLLWVLHAGYAFVPIGFALRAAGVFVPRVGSSAALHALTIGAIGVLCLGMMTRVALGHTGRQLEAPRSLAIAFGLVIFAALVRVVGAIVSGPVGLPSMHAAGGAWAIAFAIYLARIGPSLFRPRPDGKPG